MHPGIKSVKRIKFAPNGLAFAGINKPTKNYLRKWKYLLPKILGFGIQFTRFDLAG